MNSFNDAKVLVTGGLGFIGSNLAAQLVQKGAKVTLVDSLIPQYGGNLFNVRSLHSKVTVNISDVRDPFSIGHLVKEQDFIFNLAGQTSHLDSMTDPETDLEINSKAQLSILEACRKNNPKVRIVFASTRQIYGRPQYLPVDEKHPLEPVDVNGVNKLAGEHFHLLYHRVYGIRSAVLRLTNTYGPHMRVKDARQTFLGIWLKRLIEGQEILVYGDGTQKRDFNYVDDVVDAMMQAALNESSYGEIFNLGGPERVSLLELAKLLIKQKGKGEYKLIPFPEDRKSIDIGDYFGAYDKAHKKLNWSPKVALADGLARSLKFYESHLNEYL